MVDMVEEHLARELGKAEPVILDASILDLVEEHKTIREDVKQNRIQFVFPEGFNQIDLVEECRALTNIDDFDLMFDISMQMLEGKPVTILIYHNDRSKSELCSFQITDRYMNLRGVDAINDYPCLVTWMTEFIGVSLLKKYPTPLQSAPRVEESKTKTRKRATRRRVPIS